ncbi:major facilitator superfamily protein [Peptococcaceae bacterium CEB3]|nr:major facilitator superfamily protein [Peptococcaceae bacterium CEB3]
MGRWLNKNLALLFVARVIRSITQAFLVIVVPIYLARLGFSAVQIGTLFMGTTIGGALLILAVGIGADRWGRKRAMIVLAALQALGAAGFVLSANLAVLTLSSAAGTIGRGGGAGSGGAFGPFYPAEQPLLSEHAESKYRNEVFGFLSFLGVLGGAVGSLLAAVPQLWPSGPFGWRTGYLFLFALTVFSSLLLIAVVLPVSERKRTVKRQPLQLSWRLLGKFSLTNIFNGFGIGFLGPLLTYWFYVRFGAGTATIGVLFTVVNLLTALPYLISAYLGNRFGVVRTVVATRAIAVTLTGVMAFSPTYLVAGTLFALRMVFNSLGNPLRQSMVMGMSNEGERSTMAAFSNLPMQVSSALSPPLGGLLMDEGMLGLPLVLAAGFQAVNTVLYWRFFRGVRNQDLH